MFSGEETEEKSLMSDGFYSGSLRLYHEKNFLQKHHLFFKCLLLYVYLK